MRFTEVAADAFQHLQLNAGVLLTQFDPANPGTRAAIREDILCATSGGASFAANPTYSDYGEDIDNVPPNTKQMKRLEAYDPHISGTGKTVNDAALEAFLGSFDKATDTGVTTYTPSDLSVTDFKDLWWVGDYSDKNSAETGGFIAICLKNALNIGGFQLQSNDNGKGDLEFDFQGHYDIEDTSEHPFAIYKKVGTA